MNKLVRDNIPEIVKAEGRTIKYREIQGKELIIALATKLIEESQEVLDAVHSGDGTNLIEELGDLMDVYNAFLHESNITQSRVRGIALYKTLDKGGFEKGIFVEELEK